MSNNHVLRSDDHANADAFGAVAEDDPVAAEKARSRKLSLDEDVNHYLRSWHVPDSAWAGSLAGRIIPPGPADPIKARWMGFWNGAGIHGTDETWSIGHAVSHGCVRMRIADVEALYPLVPLGTPVYVG